MATYSPEQLGIKAPKDGFKDLGWYGGRQYVGGTLGEVGAIHQNSSQQGAGQQVSNEVIAQTNPANVQYIEAQRMQQPPAVPYKSSVPATQGVVNGLSTEVMNARKTLDETLGRRKAENDQKLLELREKEKQTLGEINQLTNPFREELEKTERERLFVNENFEANQTLINELDTLLTEGNEAIKQQQEVTGLASIRNPRVQKTMDDVAARAGVIQSVISARNGQIGMAFNMIDRTAGAIAADRNDKINYFNTILQLNRSDILSLDENGKKIADEQLNLLKNDEARAAETQDYVKKLMLNPATAQMMGLAGVSLNDSVEQINGKLANAQNAKDVRDMNNQMATSGYSAVLNPSSVPKNKLITITDALGNKYYYQKTETGSGAGGSVVDFVSSNLPAGMKATGGGTTATTGVPVETVQSAKQFLMSEYSKAAAPAFTPRQGPGSTFTDELGQRWQYTSNGWVRI